ncbi:MAG: hypothetical protein WBQ44_13485 [Rhodococcus sp. (in: high G+C Gram-positive bacteria)]
MNKHDKALLEFHRRWEPFGGPERSEIFVQFGLTMSDYRNRVAYLLRVSEVTGD